MCVFINLGFSFVSALLLLLLILFTGVQYIDGIQGFSAILAIVFSVLASVVSDLYSPLAGWVTMGALLILVWTVYVFLEHSGHIFH